MRPFKKVSYIALAALTLLIFLCFLLRGIAKSDVFMWIAIGLFVPFTGCFIYLTVDGIRNGWRDEKRLPNRLRAEALFCDLYIGEKKKKYCIDVYPYGDLKEFLRLLKDAARDARAEEALGRMCLGQAVFTAEELNKIEGQEIATSRPILDLIAALPDLENFYLKNEFHIY